MCGIAAAFGFNNPSKIIFSMLDILKHRGENKHEYYCLNDIGIGIRRLAIVDGSHGKQPIWNENNTIAIVHNGEIYNSNSIRRSLRKLGHTFRTQTDTEVILHSYEEYGTNCLNTLDGMFSFLIWDRNTGRFFAARDRFGIKPLYFAFGAGRFLIASEAKALLFDSQLSINELKPGQMLTQSGPLNWYAIPTISVKDTYKDSQLRIRELVMRAVKKRVSTNLPIAVFLSGGIDSSIILYAAKEYNNNVSAFTIGLPGASDVKAAVTVSSALGVKLHIYKTSLPELIACINPVIYHSESFEPNMLRAGVFSYLLSRKVQALGFKIAICGEGADEIFGGYGDFLNCESDEVFKKQTIGFLQDLYRTQLQRIDRLGMAHTIEIREPYMDNSLVEYAINLPYSYKLGNNPSGYPVTKYILRDAFRNILPDETVWRDKVSLMDGAGLGHISSSQNMLFDYADTIMSKSKANQIMNAHDEYGISTSEEALYFEYFEKCFHDRLSYVKSRPRTAKKEIEE